MRTDFHTKNYQFTAAQLDLFRCARSKSGYRNVYETKNNAAGVMVWVARVKTSGVLRSIPASRSTEPRRCVWHVAAWYADRYGPGWESNLADRKVNPFRVRHSPRYGGYVAAVWVMGQREEVVELRRAPRGYWRRTGRLAVFPTRDAARRGIAEYLDRLWGLFAKAVLCR